MDRREFIKTLGVVGVGALALPRVARAGDFPKITIEVPEATARSWEFSAPKLASGGFITDEASSEGPVMTYSVARYYLGEHEQRDALEKTLGSGKELCRFRESLARQRVLRSEVTVMMPYKRQKATIPYIPEFQLCQYGGGDRHGSTCHIFWDAEVREYEDRIVIQGDTMTPEELEWAFESERGLR